MLGMGSVILLCCQVGFSTKGPTMPPLETLWVSVRFLFSWLLEQTAITVSIVSSFSSGAKLKFKEHVLETNIWQPGSPLGVTFCLSLFPIKTLSRIWRLKSNAEHTLF